MSAPGRCPTATPPTLADASRTVRVTAPGRGAQLLRAGDAPVPERGAPHRPSEVLLAGGRDRPLPPPPGQRACCTRWATTPSGCRRRTTRSRPGVHPRVSTAESIASFQQPVPLAGGSRSTGRASWRPANRTYYRWTQWIFLELFGAGLAYRKEAAVKWCPKDQTVLANEQVDADGRCERCGAIVEVRQLEQWFLRITDYAERLLGDLDGIDWPEHVKTMQRNWIGRSEGRRGDVPLRGDGRRLPGLHHPPDTLFGATFFVMAPEHPDVLRLAAGTEHEAGGARVRQPRPQRVQRGARQRREAEDRACRWGAPSPTPSTASRSRCTWPTTC